MNVQALAASVSPLPLQPPPTLYHDSKKLVQEQLDKLGSGLSHFSLDAVVGITIAIAITVAITIAIGTKTARQARERALALLTRGC